MNAQRPEPARSPRRATGGWYPLLGAATLGIAALASCGDGPTQSGAGPGYAGTPDGGTSTGAPGAANGLGGVGRSLRRLSAREYDNVVHDLLGDTTQPAKQFGQEVYTNGFDNGSDSLTVQGTDVVAFQLAAESLAAAAVANNLASLIGSCDPAHDAQACAAAFLAQFASKAYRRPLTSTEQQRLLLVYAAGAAKGGFKGGIQLMLEAVLQSPAFLYREELGVADPSLPKGVVRLTDYEVATELSFLLTGSMPDPTLFAAAASGMLKTTSDIRREATRLLATPQARPAFRAFLNQWMATDQVSTISKDATIYPNFNPALAASMAAELDQYFDQVLWSGTGSMRELLTSPRSFLDANLATSIYNVPPPATGFQSTLLDLQTRQGILTRAGFLTAHADVDSSGPVPRGVFVLNALLCVPPLSPPPNVPSPPPVAETISAHQTTRQRFGMHLSESFCSSCHDTIDGIGFGFEEFDGLGVYRTTENGSPVDTSGNLRGSDVDGPFVGASELARKLVGSKEVLGCYIKQAYRYAMGQQESYATREVLAAMQAGFTVDSRVTDAFTSLMADPSFVQRTTAQSGP
jgi:uncharacterized protein DUF1592/uncharacterized protein DUF1588/uncharacterized protein DUF1595/uncharacterized protein DUF1587